MTTESPDVPEVSVSQASADCAKAIADLEGWDNAADLTVVEQLIARYMRQVVLSYRTENEYRAPLKHMLASLPHVTELTRAERGCYYDGLVTGRLHRDRARYYAEWLQHPEEAPNCRVYLLYDLPERLWTEFEASPSEFWLRDDLKPVGWCTEDDSREPSLADRLVIAVTDTIRRTMPPFGAKREL